MIPKNLPSNASPEFEPLGTASVAPKVSVIDVSWIALYTRSRHEKAAEGDLREMGFETYLPLRQELRHWKDRRKLIEAPLFPGYLFVRCAEAERTKVLAARGVVRCVTAQGAPARVDSDELESIREALSRHVPFDPNPEIQPGQRVEVVDGPMRGVRGTLLRRGKKYRLILQITALGRGISVEIEASDVRPI